MRAGGELLALSPAYPRLATGVRRAAGFVWQGVTSEVVGFSLVILREEVPPLMVGGGGTRQDLGLVLPMYKLGGVDSDTQIRVRPDGFTRLARNRSGACAIQVQACAPHKGEHGEHQKREERAGPA